MMSTTDLHEIPFKLPRLCDDSIKKKDLHSSQAEFVPSLPKVVNSRDLLYEMKFFNLCVRSKDGCLRALCNICSGDLSPLHRGNLIAHLKTFHSAEHEKYSEYSKLKKTVSVSSQPPYLQESFDEKVTNFILQTMVPFNIVEEESFRNMFDDKTLKHMTKDSLTMKIREKFKESIDEIRQIVAGTESVWTTVDVWSGKNGRFLGVTLHWIDEETYVRQSAAIACKHFPESPGHEATPGHDIRNCYNLTQKSGSIFVGAFKKNGLDALDKVLFGKTSVNGEKTHIVEDFLSDDSASEDHFSKQCRILLQHFRCASDTLELVVTIDIIKPIEQSGQLSGVLDKCTSFWGSLRSPKVKNYLRTYLDIELIEPVASRWKSVFDALQQLLTLKAKLSAPVPISFDNADGITLTDTFTQSDFECLSEYVECTRPVAEAIDRLHIKTHCHYGYLLPTLVDPHGNKVYL